MAVPIDGMGTASVELVLAPPVPGVQKPPPWVGKRFRDRIKAVPKEDGEETSGSENKTRFVAAGLPGCRPSGLPRRRGLPCSTSAAVQALRWLTVMTFPGSDSDGEGAGSTAQNCVGAVIERLNSDNVSYLGKTSGVEGGTTRGMTALGY